MRRQEYPTQRRQGPQGSQSKKEGRRARYAAVNATWNQLALQRVDLRHATTEEKREARLDYAAAVLGIDPIGSLSDLTIPQLGRVIEAMKRDLQQPTLAGVQSTDFSRRLAAKIPTEVGTLNASADVIHLASDEQTWAIEQVLAYLRSEWGWTEEGCAGFLKKNYRRPGARLLTPRQASGALTILLSICAKKVIDRRKGNHDKRSRAEFRREMPSLKKRIGIDCAATARRGDGSEDAK